MRVSAAPNRIWLAALLYALSFFGARLSLFASPTNEITWRQNKTVDASIYHSPLQRVLGRLSGASGWKVFVDPSLEESITVKFTNVPQGQALKLLLGSANYALVPDARSGSKLYVYKNDFGDATSLITPDRDKGKNWIPNELILTLTPGSTADVEKLAAELGGKIVAKSDGLNAYRLQFADAEAAETAREKLAARNGFDTQDNYSIDRPSPLTTSTAMSPAAMFPLDTKPVARGDQITVALVDTPIQPIEGKMKDFILPSVHVSGEPDSLPSDPTHATSMAETLLNSMIFTKGATEDSSKLGNVRVLPIDIYGNSPSTTTFEVAQGLYKAIQSGAQVVNLSLGGSGESPMVDYLLEEAKKRNIMVFASAGNSPTTDPTWPAANPNVIAVTAADQRGDIAAYANRGSFVDVKAPGSMRVYYNGQTYISSGTSTATAFVSGQAAGLAAQGFNSTQTTGLILKNFDVNAVAPPRATKTSN